MARLLVLNGPNLNLLGTREPAVYGTPPLEDIRVRLTERALSTGHQLEWLQSNAEHELVERVHRARQENIDFILLNPAAFTHTSVALRDALTGVDIPFIELHLSNVHAREPFRAHSYFTDVARGVIAGFGAESYTLALEAALSQLDRA